MSNDAQPEAEAAKPPDDPQTIAVGRILRQRFELLEEIGRGGLSRVFKAKDLVAERAGLAKPVVALKIVQTGADSDPDIVALMYREARRLRVELGLLLMEARRLHAQAVAGECELRQQALNLLAALRRLRDDEADLTLESVTTDLGAGD